MALTTAAGSCAGGVGLAVAGLPEGAAGGGAGASGASVAAEELAGAEESGTDLQGEEVVFFSGTGGTRGSALSASSVPAPMLMAPVS